MKNKTFIATYVTYNNGGAYLHKQICRTKKNAIATLENIIRTFSNMSNVKLNIKKDKEFVVLDTINNTIKAKGLIVAY